MLCVDKLHRIDTSVGATCKRVLQRKADRPRNKLDACFMYLQQFSNWQNYKLAAVAPASAVELGQT